MYLYEIKTSAGRRKMARLSASDQSQLGRDRAAADGRDSCGSVCRDVIMSVSAFNLHSDKEAFST